ncbi:MAG TPA: hypothetical protein ENK82_08350 [Campylobacterales bacterium]|nr:hypothetical protein [Campylobacterales bacterium]HHS93345.1 hypothetical protein [Campylobacterales bacterium]
MKNVLILANGQMAKHFVQWVGSSRIDYNHYYITYNKDELEASSTFVENITYLNIDPTSYMRVRNVMEDKNFTTVFIVIEDRKEAEYAYKNVRMIRSKTLIVFVSMWDDLSVEDDNVKIINVNEVMAANLYEKLPNVPLIAKNIGLGQGEIMEIFVPFGSSFAYRHVGAISHKKWKIVAFYRQEKQMFVTNTTMLKPNDRLIVVGNPLVLEEVYKKVNRRQGVFPEPFGRHLYLLISMKQKKEEILTQINEAIFLSNKLKKTKLYIRLINANNFDLINEIRGLQTNEIQVLVTYNNRKIPDDIDADIGKYEIGLFLLDRKHFFNKRYNKVLTAYKRPIFLFGEKSIYTIKKVLILMGEESDMESLSVSAFDFSDSLSLKLNLCNYSPDGDFQDAGRVIEHYESLARLYNFQINIEQKKVNPIRELLSHEDVLHIIPFGDEIKKFTLFQLLSTKLNTHILSIKKHPQLLIPVNT